MGITTLKIEGKIFWVGRVTTFTLPKSFMKIIGEIQEERRLRKIASYDDEYIEIPRWFYATTPR